MSLDQQNGPVLNVPFAFGLDEDGNQVPLVGTAEGDLQLTRGPTRNVPFAHGLDTVNNVQVPLFGFHPDSPGGPGGAGLTPTDAYRLQKMWDIQVAAGTVIPDTTNFNILPNGLSVELAGLTLEDDTDLTLESTIQWDTSAEVFISGPDFRSGTAGPHVYPETGTYEIGVQINDAADNLKTNRQFRKSITVTRPPLVIQGFVRFDGLIDVAVLFGGISNADLDGTHIDWGDGTQTIVDSADFSTIIRRYAAEGTYTVKVDEWRSGVATGRTVSQAFTTTDLNPPTGGASPLP